MKKNVDSKFLQIILSSLNDNYSPFIFTWCKDRCRNLLEICSTEAFSEVEARVARVTLFPSLFSIGSLITSLVVVDSLDITR